MVSLLYGTLRKQASPTTDHSTEGANCSGATPYKRENIVLGNPVDLPFTPLPLLACEKLRLGTPSINQT